MASYRGEFGPGHPRFPIGSQAAINLTTAPVDVSSPNIVYSSEDNDAIDTFHREMGMYIWILVWCVSVLTGFQLELRGILYGGLDIRYSDTDPIADGNLCNETTGTRRGGRSQAQCLWDPESESCWYVLRFSVGQRH